MVRGIERTAIFRDDADRADFVGRLARVAEQGALTVCAWALLPNHAHLLVRTGSRPLARSMRSLLTGYAGAFNRRHRRVGHLFQNRYKSIVVEEEPYLLELVRYLHLNPLRAKVVADRRALDRYPWTGHSALLGAVPRPWQETATILAQFGPTPAAARRAYRAFLGAGIPQGRRPELQGGGLVRSLGGWAAVAAVRRGREAYMADERILGTGAFVEALRREVDMRTRAEARLSRRRVDLPTLVQRMSRSLGVPPDALLGRSRVPAAAQGRQLLAYVWVECLGRRASDLAQVLGQTRGNVSVAAKRGAALAARWTGAIAEWCK